MKQTIQNLLAPAMLMALLVSLSLVTSPARASLADYAVVKDNHLNFNGKSYFRGGSEDIYLGAYGEKKQPLTKTNYLEVQDGIPVPKLKVREAVEVKIDFSKTSEKDFLANINVAGVFKGSSGTAYKDMKSGKLRLVKFTVDNEDMKTAANDSPKALNNLKSYGNDVRIASQVFIVMDAEIARTFTSASSYEVSLSAGLIKVSVAGGGGSSGTTTVSVSAGSCFAYGLVKLDWNDNKTKITKLTDDQWSLN
jgi:hypothetical protein